MSGEYGGLKNASCALQTSSFSSESHIVNFRATLCKVLALSKAVCGSEGEGCSFSDQYKPKKILSDISGKFFPSGFPIENRRFEKRKVPLE